jgi:hypothetical protein
MCRSGCNECNSIGRLINVVAQEDQSRAIRAASPSSGFRSGVHTLTDFPTGGAFGGAHHHAPLKLSKTPGLDGIARRDDAGDHSTSHPYGGQPGEYHGPYASAALWPAVNGGRGDNSHPGAMGTMNPMATVRHDTLLPCPPTGLTTPQTTCTLVLAEALSRSHR